MKKEVIMPFIKLLGEDVDLQAALARLASQKGYRFSQLSDTPELLEIIAENPPSLIIVALKLLKQG